MYSVQMRDNAEQKNSKYGNFLCNTKCSSSNNSSWIFLCSFRHTKSTFSAHLGTIYDVQRGSVFELLLFNTDLCDCFLRTIVLTLQTLLMIPLLTKVGLHLLKSCITLK